MDSKSPDLSKHVSVHVFFNPEPLINGSQSGVNSELLASVTNLIKKKQTKHCLMVFNIEIGQTILSVVEMCFFL